HKRAGVQGRGGPSHRRVASRSPVARVVPFRRARAGGDMPHIRPFLGIATRGMLIVAAGFLAAGSADALPPLPSGWPTTLQLGVTDGSGDAARLATDAPYGFRYQ